MKKLVLIFLLALSTSFVFGQTTNEILSALANRITEETDGFITQSFKDSEGAMVYFVKPPTYYDFDLVRMSIRTVLNRYSDIEIIFNWRRHTDIYEILWMGIEVAKRHSILISYDTKEKVIMISKGA